MTATVVELFPAPSIRQAPALVEIVSPEEHERRKNRGSYGGRAEPSLRSGPPSPFSAGDPRGAFEAAVNRLICQGHIDLGHAILRVYAGFCRPGQTPSAEQAGQCAGLLAKADPSDPMALGLARRAWSALGEMAFSQPQPECA